MKHLAHPLVLATAAAAAALLAGPAPADLQANGGPVTVFVVRHAETGPQPERPLSATGRSRAAALAQTLAAAGVTHLFSTDLPRTRDTLAPLAAATKVAVRAIDDQREQVAGLRALPPGSVAVVAGHSNTVPALIGMLGTKVQDLTPEGHLAPAEHDRLFVVTLPKGDGSTRLLELRYGDGVADDRPASRPSPAPARPVDPAPAHPGDPAAARPVDPAAVRIDHAAAERRSCSLLVHSDVNGQHRVHGQCELTYGSPQWRASHGEALAKAQPGARHQLGNAFFTTFDTSCAIDSGGARLPPGSYYLALEQTATDGMALVFLDPRPVRAKKWNANQSSMTTGGVKVPLQWRRVDEVAERLRIEMKPKGRGTSAVLRIRFGPHELTAELRPLLGT